MPARRTIKLFTDRYPLVGPAIWILSIQHFITQLVVALAYQPSYSLRLNTISDLGNTACTSFNGLPVCSPLHSLMNASFILLGITMFTGSSLIYQEFRETRGSLAGFSGMALGGIGAMLVGLYPENTLLLLHRFGAALPFFIGNLGMVVLSLALPLPRSLRTYTFLSGTVSLLALVFFGAHHYLGLGIGGMERIVAYPQTAWLIIFGMYISRSHLARRRRTPPVH